MLYTYKLVILHIIYDSLCAVIKWFFKYGVKNNEIPSVVLYPAFNRLEDIADHLYRLSWYLPERKNAKILVPIANRSLKSLCDKDLETRIKRPTCMDSDFELLLNNVEFVFIFNKLRLLRKAALILLWNKNGLSWLERFVLFFVSDGIDQKAPPPTEAGKTYSRISHWIENKKDDLRQLNREKMKLISLKSELRQFRASYLFGSGPSLTDSYNYDFSGGVRIICNSLVKNAKLMEHIRPHLIVAIDDTFHFSCSKYSGSFLRDCAKIIEKYDSKLIIPFHIREFIVRHFPSIERSVIFVPFAPYSTLPQLHFDLSKYFYIKHNDVSVLGTLLIPLGATLSNRIFFLGFDGTSPNAKRWWNYDRNSQYSDDVYRSLIDCFPSFFGFTNYDRRNSLHNGCLDWIVKRGTKQGIEFVSLSKSSVPAINACYRIECGDRTGIL